MNDPISYTPSGPWPQTNFIEMPKMVVNGGNDEFFLPDDNHWWWKNVSRHLTQAPAASTSRCPCYRRPFFC